MTKTQIGLLCAVAAGCATIITAAWGTRPQEAAAAAHACPKPARGDQVTVPGGTFEMGSDSAYPEERPKRTVIVASFQIDRYEVTNAEFAEFVSATGYVTVAERMPDPAQHPDVDPAKLVPGSAVFVAPKEPISAEGWWRFVPGANWRAPLGPGSSIEGRENFPVTHIAYEDAEAYATWRSRRLPTEAEWERAARGGRSAAPYVWGTELAPDGKWRANIWQGAFPLQDSGADGFVGIAPAGCFEANDYGLYDMIGNVWEWTSDAFSGDDGFGVIKGGSYLCAENFCARYRASARQSLERDFSAAHVGFRTVADL